MRGSINENVVDIDGDPFSQQVTEDIVEKVLEGGRSIAKTISDDQGFEHTILSMKCSEWFMPRTKAEKLICAYKVELGGELRL